MNIEDFQENLELMFHSGFKLTDLEAALIENSLIILQSENQLRDIFFFGRIDTSSAARYYISFGYREDILKECKFFYSLNGYEWLQLPDLKSKLIPIALNSRNLLTGDPMNIELVCKNPTFVENNKNVRSPCPQKVKKLKEEDRLTCMVHLIMSESAIIPRGVLNRQVTGDVTFNSYFRGMSRENAVDLKNFQFLRAPRNNAYVNLAKHVNHNYQTDFLDTLDDTLMPNTFSTSINDRDVCMIRALNWPGMTFVHKLNTKYQGCFYFGNGKRYRDLIFKT